MNPMWSIEIEIIWAFPFNVFCILWIIALYNTVISVTIKFVIVTDIITACYDDKMVIEHCPQDLPTFPFYIFWHVERSRIHFCNSHSQMSILSICWRLFSTVCYLYSLFVCALTFFLNIFGFSYLQFYLVCHLSLDSLLWHKLLVHSILLFCW